MFTENLIKTTCTVFEIVNIFNKHSLLKILFLIFAFRCFVTYLWEHWICSIISVKDLHILPKKFFCGVRSLSKTSWLNLASPTSKPDTQFYYTPANQRMICTFCSNINETGSIKQKRLIILQYLFYPLQNSHH